MERPRGAHAGRAGRAGRSLLAVLCVFASFHATFVSLPSRQLRRQIERKALNGNVVDAEEWSPEQERQVIDRVLGRVPPASQETASLTAETRLLRQQLDLLVQEIRLLRQSLQTADGTAPVPPAAPVAPAVRPSVTQATPLQSASPAAAARAAPAAPAARAASAAPAAPASAASSPSKSPLGPFPVASPNLASPPSSPAGVSSVRIVSAGYAHGNAADFYLDNNKIDVNGVSDRRGLNLVIIDPVTQQVTSRKSYDIWAEPSSENNRLAMDLNALPAGRIVMLALKDSGMENLDQNLVQALRSVGSTVAGKLPVREGYALIGTKGGPAMAEQQGGKAEVQASLGFSVRMPPPLPPMPAQRQGMGSIGALNAMATGQPQRPPQPVQQPGQQPPQWQQRQQTVPQPVPQPAQQQPQQRQQTAAPKPGTAQRVPKLQVDPQGAVSFSNALAERQDDDGKSWEEVLIMLDQLQEQIRSKRLASA